MQHLKCSTREKHGDLNYKVPLLIASYNTLLLNYNPIFFSEASNTFPNCFTHYTLLFGVLLHLLKIRFSEGTELIFKCDVSTANNSLLAIAFIVGIF